MYQRLVVETARLPSPVHRPVIGLVVDSCGGPPISDYPPFHRVGRPLAGWIQETNDSTDPPSLGSSYGPSAPSHMIRVPYSAVLFQLLSFIKFTGLGLVTNDP